MPSVFWLLKKNAKFQMDYHNQSRDAVVRISNPALIWDLNPIGEESSHALPLLRYNFADFPQFLEAGAWTMPHVRKSKTNLSH